LFIAFAFKVYVYYLNSTTTSTTITW